MFLNTFTSIVLDEHIRFSAHVLSILLDIPMIGQIINEEADMWRLGFDGLGAFLELCPAFNLGMFITRAILPRSFALDELLPLDIFILWHALHMKPLSLPHLLLIHINNAAKDGYLGDMPCATLITQLLFNMGIDLYGLEMETSHLSITVGDVLAELDLSPPNSPDPPSGGDDAADGNGDAAESADGNGFPDINTPGAEASIGVPDINTPAAKAAASGANADDIGVNNEPHTTDAVDANDDGTIRENLTDNDLEYAEVEEVESDFNNDSPLSPSLIMEQASALVSINRGILGPPPKTKVMLACPSVMAEIKESFKEEFNNADDAKAAQAHWLSELFQTKTPSSSSKSSSSDSSTKRKRSEYRGIRKGTHETGSSSENVFPRNHENQISDKELATKIKDLGKFVNLDKTLTTWASSIEREEHSTSYKGKEAAHEHIQGK
ncbi:hypothetical protein LINGRAHAP2_LOCUS24874 [Linum grandiflorum]